MPKLNVGKDMPSVQLSKEELARRFRDQFYDPIFADLETDLGKVVDIPWNAYDEYRKSPRTRPAGRGFADPTFELPLEWLETRHNIEAAQRRQKDPKSPAHNREHRRICRRRCGLLEGQGRLVRCRI